MAQLKVFARRDRAALGLTSLRSLTIGVFGLVAVLGATVSASVQAETLRLLTWGDYAPPDLIKKFKAETGIDVEVTLSNNEDMISKLRATGGAGYDLAQPSVDRIIGPAAEFKIYKPLDLTQIDTKQIDAKLLDAAKKSAGMDGKAYAVPYLWGTLGLVVDKKTAGDVKNVNDMCKDGHKGRIALRLKRTTLIIAAFANGDDPFAAYGDKAKYQKIIDKAGKTLADCKPNVKFFSTNSDQVVNGMTSGELHVFEGWDSHYFKLNQSNPNIAYVAAPYLGWIDTFALPAKGTNDAAAYKWINFVNRPDNAAVIIDSAASASAAVGASAKAQSATGKAIAAFYTPGVIASIKWFPPIPAGLEEMEGKILDSIQAK
ncbi:MAG: extracellular solute-binding protein [Candidatus Pacebacteria bacterium]|nr:extracellular solute-binding protein [Candidatus Paceibacterota bacterium]